MKVFYINHSYRGRFFDLKFCANSKKEACDILGISMYTLNNFASFQKTSEPFQGVVAIPYSHSARELLGSDAIDFEEAKKKIDDFAKQQMDKFLTEQP